ncbi:glycoside hydrolase superfamily [Truncatella angustata]|uniref:glucan endo-1,3-beta-D-glucosidase n=1 Tax=Truncatella angustata TaxID=152316 RepID=A0A9P8RHS7_9PEZI|nr:glycoside hydrolase superfamily [Truncatella angustata]KAH6646268.1 glycoside hydrolase superfamily [Truncatella angustata]
MRLSLALTGLAAVAANASCGGRPSDAASSESAAAASGYPVGGSSGSAGSSAYSSVSSAAAATAAAAATNVKSASTATAAQSGIKGFNYGAFFLNQQAKTQADFEAEFSRQQNLPTTSGFNSARLYTMIQWGTASDPIQAIPAAIATKTTLLLGLWISGGTQALTNELAALESAIGTYGTAFTDLVVGISVGSEDLYRDANNQVGTTADYLLDSISKVRSAIADTGLSAVPVGHVDTYDSFENATNTKVIDSLDFIGFDGYPFWEKALPNSIDNASERFYSGYNKTVALANGKPVYVTETGWPTVGDDENEAIASVENARKYWQSIACSLIDSNINVWWYDLQESQYGDANPDFGVYGAGDLSTLEPLYDLSC